MTKIIPFKILFAFLAIFLFSASAEIENSSRLELGAQNNRSPVRGIEIQKASNLELAKKDILALHKASEKMSQLIKEKEDFFKDKDLISITYLNNFERVGGMMKDQKDRLIEAHKKGEKILIFYFRTFPRDKTRRGGDASYYFNGTTGEFLGKTWGV